MPVYRAYILVEVEANNFSDAFNAIEDGMIAFAPYDWSYATPYADARLADFAGVPMLMPDDPKED